MPNQKINKAMTKKAASPNNATNAPMNERDSSES
jgi:hypothetical protein